MAVARPAARGQVLFVTVAFGCLLYSFIVNDFSVVNVASNSNSQLPLHYRIAASWGSHEGSLLLWVLMLAWWTFAVSIFSRHLPDDMVARVIGVQGVVSIGFLLFMLLTSNPFDRLFPAAADGRDLNPLLQDPGMVFHPPMLYMGYVGFSVAFSFAIAALLGGKLDAAWARWSRPWTTLAWCFSDVRHRARQLVGVLRTGVGRLVVLGSGGKRVVHAVAGRHRADSFARCDRKARQLQKLDGTARHLRVLAVAARHFSGPLGRVDLGARVCDRSEARRFHSCVSGVRDRLVARAVCVARAEGRPGRKIRDGVARVVSAAEQSAAGGSGGFGACLARCIRCFSMRLRCRRLRLGRRISIWCSAL